MFMNFLRYLDMFNLMTYDLHGAFEDHTGLNSPLHKDPSETGDDVYLNVVSVKKRNYNKRFAYTGMIRPLFRSQNC